jgi:hypothetical protein
MECPHCQAPNPEEATTCRECGRLLTSENTVTTTETEGSPSPGTTTPRNSEMAVASVILSILGWTVLPVIGAGLGVVLGYMARDEIRRSQGALGGQDLATLGLVLGYANLAVMALVIVLTVVAALLGIAIPLGLLLCGGCALLGA